MLNTLAASRALMDHIKKGASAIHELLRVPLFNRHIQLRLESVVRSVYTNVNYLETYIYIYIPEKGGTKASSRQTSVSFLAGVAAQNTWSAACESAVLRMRGGVCNGDGGSREASRAALG